jgi:hypothetical protein
MAFWEPASHQCSRDSDAVDHSTKGAHDARRSDAFASRDPGRAPSQNMQIFLVPPLDHFVRNILVFFKVDVPPKLGWITGLRDSLVAFFPPDAFADFYSVLRAEKPVFAQYTLRKDAHSLEDAAEGRDTDLDSFHLTTSNEPVGEGPVNLSGERERG